MDPLDLTKAPPRSPRDRVLGLMFLPRTIDKFRARLPGGNVGRYTTDEPWATSYQILAALGISIADFEGAMRAARTEDEVIRWLDEHMHHERVPAINHRLSTTLVSQLPEEDRARVLRECHPDLRSRDDLDNYLDLLEADDNASFPSNGGIRADGPAVDIRRE